MSERFSGKAFTLATLVHLAGTVALFAVCYEVVRESKHSGIQLNPVWLTVASWIWESGPMTILYLIPPLCAFPFHLYLVWSFVVGAIVGFVVPRVSRGYGNAHLTNR
jgi:hypothetical protein